MKMIARWTLLGATLPLLACSETAFESGAGGAAGASAAGSSGNAANGSSGNSQGGASGATGGDSAAAGMSAGAAMGGASGGSGGTTAGAANGNAGQSNGGAGGAGSAAGSSGAGGSQATDFRLTSPAFEHVEACTTATRDPCNFFPSVNTFTNIGGMNQSPEMNWNAGPSGTMSYVVCLQDTTANATHWCMWNIPAGTLHLPANLARQKMPAVPAGASQDGLGLGGSQEGYVGPGARGNVYQFRLYALSVASYAPPNAGDRRTVYAELEQDPNNIVLATSTLRGRANPQ